MGRVQAEIETSLEPLKVPSLMVHAHLGQARLTEVLRACLLQGKAGSPPGGRRLLRLSHTVGRRRKQESPQLLRTRALHIHTYARMCVCATHAHTQACTGHTCMCVNTYTCTRHTRAHMHAHDTHTTHMHAAHVHAHARTQHTHCASSRSPTHRLYLGLGVKEPREAALSFHHILCDARSIPGLL